MMGKFYAAQTLERLANELLARYQRKTGKPLTLPISAEHILDTALCEELKSPLWERICEPAGRTMLAGLAPAHHLIVLNETRQRLILETEGLLNTLLAHEIAHWVLHVDRALINQPALPGLDYKLHFTCARGTPSSWDEKNAHRFMS